jgi:hypothetical protein
LATVGDVLVFGIGPILIALSICRVSSPTLVHFWHIVDTVPALDIAATLHWSRPPYYADLTSAIFILAFKAFVFAPVAVGVVRLLEEQFERRFSAGLTDKENAS